MPLMDEPCRLCGAKPYMPHGDGCPWIRWATYAAARKMGLTDAATEHSVRVEE